MLNLKAVILQLHLIIYLVRDLDCFRYVAPKIQHESAVRAPEQSLIHLSVLAWTNINIVQSSPNKLFSFITAQKQYDTAQANMALAIV